MLIQSLLLIAGGYLLGSVSPTYVIGRWLGGKDLRQYGSGTLSGSMVFEHVGRWAVVPVVLFDVLKGTVPALLALWLDLGVQVAAAAGLAAAIGHNWPIYYRFQGGRGISPSMGGMLVVDWLGVVVTNILGLVSDLVIRNPLLSSGIWLGLMVPWIWLGPHGWPERIYSVAMVIIYSASMLPEWRQMLHLKRKGELDKLQLATEVRVTSRLDRGVAQQRSVADLLSELISKLRRKDSHR